MSVAAIAELRAAWRPERVFLDTAGYGLPPAPAWDALQAALADWRAGRERWERWCEATEASRAAFAALVGVDPRDVALGATVSGLVGLIAASLPRGTRVLAPEGEFTSLVFPFLAQADRGLEVRFAPRERLAEAIDARTDLVAFSAVQSADGALAELDAIATAARHHGAATLLDATQAAGWLPLDGERFDAIACAAYKWLMSPRGVAFLTLRGTLAQSTIPHAAGWYAGPDPFATFYGAPLRLAPGARRLDTSPAWFSWVGAAPALELLLRVGVEVVHAHDVGLANRFRRGLRLPEGDSAIVSFDAPGAEERLARAGVMTSARGGRVRASFHLYNGEDDVDAALDALEAP